MEVKMINDIIRDYFAMFRIGNLKKNNLANKLSFFSLYFIGMTLCGPFLAHAKISWRVIAVQFAVFVPIVFSYFSVLAHPIRLPKMMYLCPMQPDERRKYIYGSYYFRIGVHMLPGVLGVCIAVVYSYCDIFSVIEMFLNYLMVALLVSREQSAKGKVRGMVIGEIIFVIAILSGVIQVGIIADAEPDMGMKAVLFAVFCLVQLPLEIRHLKSAGKQLQAAVSFENVIH